MDLSLGEKQRLFVHLFGQWLSFVYSRGYEVTWGEAFRSDEQAEINAIGSAGRTKVAALVQGSFPALAQKLLNNGKNNGIRASAHQNKLALDLNLFKDGEYLSLSEQWSEVGTYWESLHPLCRWGGRWGDGNHLSLEHNGIK